MKLTCITPFADILAEPQSPDIISNGDSQLIYGESFIVKESRGAYVYGYSALDGYKGCVMRDQLVKNAPELTHFINTRLSHIYAYPSFKSRPLMPISFLSRIALNGEIEGDFSQTSDGDWIFTKHISPIVDFKKADNLGDIAMIFLGTPYLYAGRTSMGLDCSALVQLSMIAAGYDCPARDSGDQEKTIGNTVDIGEIKRGDIIFFKGHVGIMVDDKSIINATARSMNTLIEPLETLANDCYGGITSIKRL